jgi:AcrR family transcriptional regulator
MSLLRLPPAAAPAPETQASAAPAAVPATADRILDAAEAVFAREGYYAATIRGITQAAGVPLNLARYYFGSKDQLFMQVVGRRAQATCDQLDQALDAALARSDPPELEAVVAAMVSLAIERLSTGDLGWRHYLQLLANLGPLLERPELLAPLRDRYMPTRARYRQALQAALPHASNDAIDYGLHFLQVLVGHAVIDISAARYIGGGWTGEVRWAELQQQLVAHVVGGLRAQVQLLPEVSSAGAANAL